MAGRQKVAVVGSGAWGTTLALLGLRAGQATSLYVRDRASASRMSATRTNDGHLPGVPLPVELEISADLQVVCRDAAVVLVVVPSHAMRENSRSLATVLEAGVVVSAAKGLEPGSLKRMSEVVAEELPAAAVCALSGPNLAREIAVGKPATTVIASKDLGVAEGVQDLLMSDRFRCYTNEDVVGVEMGGALKNIIAIGAGMADGMGVGDNAKAAFLTRGIAEIARLGVAAGANPLTFSGLTGLGDLVATCASPLSRNHFVGAELAKGRPLDEILGEMNQVAEGVGTTAAARELAHRLGVEMPITEQMYGVLFEGKPAQAAIAALMRREAKHELDGLRFGK